MCRGLELRLIGLVVLMGGCEAAPAVVSPDGALQDAPSADMPLRDSSRPDAPLIDGSSPDAPQPDVPLADLLQADSLQADAPLADAPLADAPSSDAPLACIAHCDCPQGHFCYYGACLNDPKLPIYCCAKSGCPPGRWCVDPANKKAICPEDASYPCKDACDCGPAHCCKNGECVKDLADPWMPGGTIVGSAGQCKQGTDATYCSSDPPCHAGKFAYGNASALFRCYNRDKKKTEPFCGGKSCFGTACNCPPGESCVDTVENTPPGTTCNLLHGGSCVSNAVAESLFGFKSSDLLPCCAPGCPVGMKCEVGWKTDDRHAFARGGRQVRVLRRRRL